MNNGAIRITNPAAQLAAAKNPETPSVVLDMLANCGKELVLLAVAENEATSVATRGLALQKLIDRDIFIRKIASAPLTPSFLLEVLARHPVEEVRLDVAENRATPVAALAALATDPVRYVRSNVACNRSTPAYLLEILGKDSDLLVVAGMLGNPNVPAHILEQMGCSENIHMRYVVASNSATPKHILELLLNDEMPQIRKQAKFSLKFLSLELVRQPATAEQIVAARQDKTAVPKPVKRKPAAAKVIKVNTEMVVSRPAKSQVQIAKASELKQVLIDDIKTYFPEVLKPKKAASDERRLLSHIELAAESYDVTFRECCIGEVDRTASMASGPFFTTKKHPIPKSKSKSKSKSEMLYPIVQLDLRTASMLSGEPIGDGLLQLWYDINTFKGLVRVIPRQDVNTDNATEFQFFPAQKFGGFPLPLGWNSDPIGDVVQVISGCKSIGMACQKDYGSIYLDGMNEQYEVPEDLCEMVEHFERLTDVSSSSKLQLFGTFYPIQYSAADVGKRCLFVIGGDWGATGGAQVFYEIGKNGQTSFTFLDCFR